MRVRSKRQPDNLELQLELSGDLAADPSLGYMLMGDQLYSMQKERRQAKHSRLSQSGPRISTACNCGETLAAPNTFERKYVSTERVDRAAS